jgi:SurA N-terminal domain
MIENLRKYPGVIVAALVAVCLGFLLMDSQNFFRSGSDKAITVDGFTYNQSEFRRLGENSMRLLPRISQQSGYMAMFALMGKAGASGESQDLAERNFFVNRMLVRKAGKEMGLIPSKEEIATYLQEKSSFAQPSPTDMGKKVFNAELYDNFIKNGLGQNGLSEKDFLDLVRDLITYEKINELLEQSIEANRDAAKAETLADAQKIDVQFIEYKTADYEAKQTPAEDEVKTFWELKKDAYKTDTRRRFSYLVIAPQYPAGAEKAPEPPKPAKPGDPVPEPSPADKDITKKRKEAENIVADRLDSFLEDLEQRPDSDVAALATEANFGEWKSTDFFHTNNIPDTLLQITLRAGEQKTMNQLLFGSKITSDPLSKVLYVTTAKEEQLLIKIDAEEATRVKTYEEAKVEAKLDLIKENAIKQMKEEAEATRKSLADAIAAGKSFADAAKDAKLTTTSVKDLSKGASLPNQPHASSLFDAARLAKPSMMLEKTKTSSESELVIFVEKRVVVIDPTREDSITGAVTQNKSSMTRTLFDAWLEEQRASIKVQ